MKEKEEHIANTSYFGNYAKITCSKCSFNAKVSQEKHFQLNERGDPNAFHLFDYNLNKIN